MYLCPECEANAKAVEAARLAEEQAQQEQRVAQEKAQKERDRAAELAASDIVEWITVPSSSAAPPLNAPKVGAAIEKAVQLSHHSSAERLLQIHARARALCLQKPPSYSQHLIDLFEHIEK